MGLAAKIFVLLLVSTPAIFSCETAQPPPYFRVTELSGTPYERGFQHGRLYANEIRSIYTQILTASILPYLNRERSDIASVLVEYQDPLYDDGQFSYQLMLRSAQNMEESIPDEYIEELQGIADGANLPYDEILIFNTFVETMISLRAITYFIRDMEAPYVAWVSWEAGLDSDGIDNDGDGEVDQENEGTLDPYQPSPLASMVEVPIDATFKFLLIDQAGAASVLGLNGDSEPEGVDPESIRIQLDTDVFEAQDPEITTRTVQIEEVEAIEVTFTPPGGFQPAAVHSLLLQGGDVDMVTEPPPSHTHFFRDERLVFTTEGYGQSHNEVGNRGERDGRTQPSPLGFAARGSATSSGEPIMAHHFAMLDVNSSHKHTVLFVHHTDDGRDHAVLGWTGMVGGFSGMNADGLSLGINPTDSFDISMVENILSNLTDLSDALLLCRGVPTIIMSRMILAETSTAQQAADLIEATDRPYSWNYLMTDRDGEMMAVEVDSSILGDGGYQSYTASDGPEPSAMASIGPDDLRIASHYSANTQDIGISFVRAQRFWSRYYFRSLRTFYILGDRIDSSYGSLDIPKTIEILRDPDLVDPQDSMSAVVFEPSIGRLHVAMGQVPATDGEFIPFDLDDFLSGESEQ